jgi:hypothetical protein
MSCLLTGARPGRPVFADGWFSSNQFERCPGTTTADAGAAQNGSPVAIGTLEKEQGQRLLFEAASVPHRPSWGASRASHLALCLEQADPFPLSQRTRIGTGQCRLHELPELSMKVETFGYVIAAIVVMGILSELVCYLRPVRAVLSGTNAVVPPFIAVVAVIFGLFAAANASDIWGRSRALRITTEREVTTARSIVKFTENVGAEANLLRRALYDYLDAATTTERSWMETGEGIVQPAQGAADALIQEATTFATTSNAAPSLKSLIVTRVDELRGARAERLTRFVETGSILHWLGLATLAIITQISISLEHIGKPTASATAQFFFTVSVVVAFLYLAFEDGVIGASRTIGMMDSIEGVLNSMSYGGVGFGR